MEVSTEQTCFYANQITLENQNIYKDHILACRACQAKVQNLDEHRKMIAAHFSKFNIDSEHKQELLKDLVFVEKILYPSTATLAKKRINSFSKSFLLNSFIFIKSAFTGRNLVFLLVAAIFLLIFI